MTVSNNFLLKCFMLSLVAGLNSGRTGKAAYIAEGDSTQPDLQASATRDQQSSVSGRRNYESSNNNVITIRKKHKRVKDLFSLIERHDDDVISHIQSSSIKSNSVVEYPADTWPKKHLTYVVLNFARGLNRKLQRQVYAHNELAVS